MPLQRIVVPATADQFVQAAGVIRDASVVGFDTESKPTFEAGAALDGPHVVQFATAEQAFIFQLIHPQAADILRDLLAAPGPLKVGFGLQSDRARIQSRLGVHMSALVDLDTVFRRMGYRHAVGVRAAVGLVLQQHFVKSKKISTSNWAVPALSGRQLQYAANDAYAALQVYHALAQDPALRHLGL